MLNKASTQIAHIQSKIPCISDRTLQGPIRLQLHKYSPMREETEGALLHHSSIGLGRQYVLDVYLYEVGILINLSIEL